MTVLIINASGILLMMAIAWWFWLYPRNEQRKLSTKNKGASNISDQQGVKDKLDDREYQHRNKIG